VSVRPSCGDKLATPASVQLRRTTHIFWGETAEGEKGGMERDSKKGKNSISRVFKLRTTKMDLYFDCDQLIKYLSSVLTDFSLGISDKADGGSHTKRIPVFSLDALGSGGSGGGCDTFVACRPIGPRGFVSSSYSSKAPSS